MATIFLIIRPFLFPDPKYVFSRESIKTQKNSGHRGQAKNRPRTRPLHLGYPRIKKQAAF